MSIVLNINGETRTYLGDPRLTLMEVLRETYRLTGTKAVCGEGFCGSCMVEINGEAVPSCLRPMALLDGAEVTTIEGMRTTQAPTALQKAFLEHDVVQCGMCFPGMVMSLSRFASRTTAPSRQEVKDAMVGNLCRCTGYERIIDAVMSMHRPEEGQQ